MEKILGKTRILSVMFKVSGRVILGHVNVRDRRTLVNKSCDAGDRPLNSYSFYTLVWTLYLAMMICHRQPQVRKMNSTKPNWTIILSLWSTKIQCARCKLDKMCKMKGESIARYHVRLRLQVAKVASPTLMM